MTFCLSLIYISSEDRKNNQVCFSQPIYIFSAWTYSWCFIAQAVC